MKKVNLKMLIVAGLASSGLLMSCGPQGSDKSTSCAAKKQEATQKRTADGSSCNGDSSCSGDSSCGGGGCNGCTPVTPQPDKDANKTSQVEKRLQNQRASIL